MSSHATTLDLDLQRHTARQRPAGGPPPRRLAAAGGGQPLVPRRLEERAAGPHRLRPPVRAHALPGERSTCGTNEHFRYIQQVGGVANGSTWYDRTNYYETVPAHHLDLALWLESDRMGFLLPALTQENLDTQRDVVMNERRQRVENQPYGRAGERLHELLYPPGHPYHWPVIGYMEDIAAATLEDVRSLLPHLLHAQQRGAHRWPATSSRTRRWSGSRPGSARSRPGRRCRRSSPPLLPLGGERAGADRTTSACPGSTSASAPRPTASGAWYAADLLAARARRRQVEPALPRPGLRAADRAGRRRLGRAPTSAAATFMLVATARPGVAAEALEEALLGHLARGRLGAPPIRPTSSGRATAC